MSKTRRSVFRNRNASAAANVSGDGQTMVDAMLRLSASASYRILESRMVFDGAAVDTAAQVADASKPAPETPCAADTASAQPTAADVAAALAAQPAADTSDKAGVAGSAPTSNRAVAASTGSAMTAAATPDTTATAADKASTTTATAAATGAASTTAASDTATTAGAGSLDVTAAVAAATTPQAVTQSPPAAATSHEIAFVDMSVADAQTLVDAIPTGVEIVRIDPTKDGIDQMAAALAGRHDISAIHILSHGSEAHLVLGTADLNAASMATTYAADLAVIRSALNDTADILVYGCDFAKGADGAAAAAELARLTGADVAASTDATGAADRGGNWTLEDKTGAIETTGVFAPGYKGLLTPLTVTPVDGTTTTALTLAQTIMGSDVSIVSATLGGANQQAGTFSGATGYTPAWLTFDTGVIFSSGRATSLTTSNTADGDTSFNSSTPSNIGTAGTAGFNTVGGGTSYDASYIDITFVPTNERISLQFVFGSDEYNEYVYASVNDAIGVWVNNTNIAVTPTGAPVGIDTINNASAYHPSSGKLANDPDPTNGVFDSAAPSLFINNDPSDSTPAYATSMDGFTRTLGATITVTPNVANTIRIGIADIGDRYYNSWLLVKAGSAQANLIAQNDIVGTRLDTPVTISPLGNDIDFDSDPISIVNIVDQPVSVGDTLTLSSGAKVHVNANGTLDFTPAPGSTTPELFTYTITDNAGNTATAYVTVNIVTGTAPTVDLDASGVGTGFSAKYVPGGSAVHIADVDTSVVDPDSNIAGATIGISNALNGDSLTAGTLPSGITIASSTATSIVLTGNATAAQYALAIEAIKFANSDGTPDYTTRNIAVQLTDTSGLSSNIAVSSISFDHAPTATPATASGNEDGSIAVALGGTDIDGTVAAVTVTTLPPASEGILYLPDGVTPVVAGTALSPADAASLVFKPAANYNGTASVSFTVTDDSGAVSAGADAVVTVHPVNDAPTATATTASGNEDTAISVTLGGTDIDGSIAAVTVTSLPPAAEGILYLSDGVTPVAVGTALSPADAASLVFKPAANYNGTASVSFTVTDDSGAVSAGADAVVTVHPVNDAPTATPATASGNEDSPIVVALGGSDIDGSISAVTVTSLPPASEGILYLPDGVTPVAAGTALSPADAAGLVFKPAANYNGTASIGFTVTDDSGAVSAGADAVVTIHSVNDAPTATPATASGNEDTSIAVALGGTDIDGSIAAVTVTNLPPASEGILYLPDGVTPVAAGTALSPADAANLVFKPAANYNGTASISFTVTDDSGAVSSGADAVVTVHPVNDAPTATPATASGNEDGSIAVTLGGTDIDGNIAAVTVTTLPPAAEGVLYLSDGVTPVAAGTALTPADAASLVFKPAVNYNGTASIGFTVTDDSGAVSAGADAIITIQPVNDAPTATTTTVSVLEDHTLDATLPVATDVDGDALTYGGGSTQPSHGTVVINADGTFTYKPDADFNGTDAFTYTVSDGTVVVEKTVTVKVTAVNDTPVAVADLATTRTETPLVVNVLANDRDTDHDPLTVVAATSSNGTVTINRDGTLTFVPTDGFSGTAVITYTVSDGHGGTATAQSTVTVIEAVGTTTPQRPDPGPVVTPPSAPPSPVHVDGIVLDVVRDVGGRGHGGEIGERGIVLATVDGIAPLGDAPVPGAEPGTRTTLHRTALERLLEIYRANGGAATWDVQRLTGFSLRLGLLDNAEGDNSHSQVVIESLVRERTLMVQITDALRDNTRTISEYRVMMANGAPLPGWLERIGGDLLLGERPAHVDRIALRIVVLYSDGTSETKTVSIETTSGEIKPVAEKRAERVLPFTHQFAAADDVPHDAFDDLAALLRELPLIAAE